jgi:hypothetical protein
MSRTGPSNGVFADGGPLRTASGHMNFRLIWMGSDEDPDKHLPEEVDVSAVRVAPSSVRYERQGGEMVRRRQLPDGRLKFTTLANFTARIVRDLVQDDDAERQRLFEVEAKVGGKTIAFVIHSTEFARMAWILNRLGPQAVVYPGQQQHARAAIQQLSGSIRQERIFTHLGWRKQDSEWMYLQAGGAVGALGLRLDFRVQLPQGLRHYQLRLPADQRELVSAIRASLDFLSVAPDRITLPLLAAVYRAPWGGTDFSVYLTGRTGTFKTALAALCQQHFGAAMDAGRVPANFASTANALESLAFSAKDALLVVDDFAPTGGVGDGTLEAVAERLFRAAGNHQGRSRMIGIGRVREPQPPRGLILATGEEVPSGHSLRARLLIVEVGPGEVDRAVLTERQRAGQEGQLAAAMGGFLAWVAGQFEELQTHRQMRARVLRNKLTRGAVHARVPAVLAELQSGWEIWLQFALDVGAINRDERAELEQRSQTALSEVAVLQAPYHHASDAGLRFVALLRAALAGGQAHVADRRGKMPQSPEVWGWYRQPGGKSIPQGARIGWVAGNDLFLEPTVSYQMAQQVAGSERLSLSEQTLRRRLREQGLLASIDAGRQMLQVRRILEGVLRQVLHVNAARFINLPAQND